MSKKLFIAVMTLSLLLAFGTAVFSDTPYRHAEPLPTENPNAPAYGQHDAMARFNMSGLQRPTERTYYPSVIPKTVLPQPTCTDQDYVDYSGGFWGYSIPQTGYIDAIGMRQTVQDGYACSLDVAYFYLFGDYGAGADVEIAIQENNAGVPGAVIFSDVIPYASLTIGGWNMYDFAGDPLVAYLTHDYFVTARAVNGTVDVDGVTFGSDQGTNPNGRSVAEYGGTWYSQIDLFSEDDNYLLSTVSCCEEIPYSECYEQFWIDDWYYIWSFPRCGSSDARAGFSVRFSVAGPETLKTAWLGTYDAFADYGAPYGEPTYSVCVDIAAYNDVAGVPDFGSGPVTHVETVCGINKYDFSGSSIPYYLEVDFSADNFVPRSDFHIAITGDVNQPAAGEVAYLWANEDDAVGEVGYDRGCVYMQPGDPCALGVAPADEGWFTDFDYYGSSTINRDIGVELCKDEYSTCKRRANDNGPAFVYPLNNVPADLSMAAQRSSTEGECRIEEVRWYTQADAANVDSVKWTINGDNLGVPGAVLWEGWIYPPFGNGRFAVPVDPPIVVDGVYYLVAEPYFSAGAPQDYSSYFKTVMDIGCETPNPGNGLYFVNDGTTGWLPAVFDLSGAGGCLGTVNWVADVFYCCIPPSERVCVPGDDWPTAGHDFRRTAASGNSTGDAQCKQDLEWFFPSPDLSVYARPVVADTLVLVAYNSSGLRALSLNTGALAWQITGPPTMGGSFRGAPTVFNERVYYGAGTFRTFSCADLHTGAPIWSAGAGAFVGNTQYTTSVILNDGTDNIVYLGTSAGEVYAINDNASIGGGAAVYYTGWGTNPVMVDGDISHSMSSNGEDVLYVGDDGADATSGFGSVTAIDALTGAKNWQFTDADWAGVVYDGDVESEWINNPVSVDAPSTLFPDGGLYFQTSMGPLSQNNVSGVMYRVTDNGGSFTTEWVAPGRRSWFAGAMMDQNLVYAPRVGYYLSEQGGMVAYQKNNGSFVYTSPGERDGAYWVEGALSCEPFADDLAYMCSDANAFDVFDAQTGDRLFEYSYIPDNSTRGTSAAITPTHVILGNIDGDVYAMTEQANRPRLRILTYDEYQAVPFFSPSGYIVQYDDVFMNNGCADMTFTLTVEETEPAALVATSIPPQRIARMAKAADEMVDFSYEDMAKSALKNDARQTADIDEAFAQSALSKPTYSQMSAYQPPAWLMSYTTDIPSPVAPGGVVSVIYTVDGPLVTRGAHPAYVIIATNDQYFLDDAAESPSVQLGVIGGCLQSEDVLTFGPAGANQTAVYNTGEIADGDDWPGTLIIDGNDQPQFQATWQVALTETRKAWTSDDWSGNSELWNFLLPDPNCADQCEPYVVNGVLLGNYNGVDIFGNASVEAYIDSALQLDCDNPGTWDWTATDCPFSNDSTIGLRIDEYMYGALDADAAGLPDLNNVVIYRIDMTNRNARLLAGLASGTVDDWDLESNHFDVVHMSTARSIAWSASCNDGSNGVDETNTWVYGWGKIPYTTAPMHGAKSLAAGQSMWTGNYWLDSSYFWMTDASTAGLTHQAGIIPCSNDPDDRDAWYSWGSLDLGDNASYSFGTYVFGFNDGDATDVSRWEELALRVNQLAGFGRGDIDGDLAITIADVVALYNVIFGGAPGPGFAHLADVDGVPGVNVGDLVALADYIWLGTPLVEGWALPDICP
jgi:hypothetical protein